MCTEDRNEFAGRRATPEEHLQVSDLLRTAAVYNLRTGNLALASEAFWGVVAHILQAIAERHGIKHTTNRDFEVINDWLVAKTGNDQMRFWFRRAYRLHQNFYRIVMTIQDIDARAQYAIALADAARPFAQTP